MQKRSAFLAAMAAVGATLTGACSGGSPPPALPSFALRSGADSRFAPAAPAVSREAPPRSRVEHELFVSNDGNALYVFTDKRYRYVGEITAGLDGADGVWVDKHGNVYVANYAGVNVTEYERGSSTPACVYTDKLVDPVDVTTDEAGNVYVADGYNYSSYLGYVYKYQQCRNSVLESYAVNGGPEGVAVDRNRDIFVSYLVQSSGYFEEFKRGKGKASFLGATVGFAGGIVLDDKGNLIADDQTGEIDIIAPPYATARVFTKADHPFHSALNKREDLLFDADISAGSVSVYKYPSGKLVRTLGKKQGIYGVAGVGESPDATF